MKYLILITLFLVSFNLQASCRCLAMLNGVFYFDQTVVGEEACHRALMEENLNNYKVKDICSRGAKSFELNWSCESKALKPKTFSCKEVNSVRAAGDLMDAALFVNHFAKMSEIAPVAPGSRSSLCGKGEGFNQVGVQANKLASYGQAKNPQALVLELKDRNELLDLIKRIFPDKSGTQIGNILDQIEGGAFSFSIHNDNSLTDIGKRGESDDVGNTHGIKASLTKAWDGSGYRLKFEYESNLYTNYKSPDNRGFWVDDDGNYHVPQNFIEENIIKVALEKHEDGSNFFWKMGGGLHQLNKSDTSGALGFFSALGSQNAFHKYINNVTPGAARTYENEVQEGDELAPMIEVGVGGRKTLLQGQKYRVFGQASLESRATVVNDASYAKGEVSGNFDYQVSNNTAARLTAGVSSKRYLNGDSTDAKFIEVVVGTREFKGGVRYDFLDGHVPNYQNAMPQKQIDRKDYAAPEETLWTLFVDYKWK